MGGEQADDRLIEWQSHFQVEMLSQMSLELKSEFRAENKNLGASVCRGNTPRVDGIAYGKSVREREEG